MANDPMADIMSADDAIDDLPGIGVMDLYVRAKLMKATMEFYSGRGPSSWDCDGFKDAENTLMNGSKDAVRSWAANESLRGVLSGWLMDMAKDNRAEDFVIAVFNKITNNDWDRDKSVSVARDYLKDYLSGSMGMPDDRVIRENLKNYKGDS